MKEYLKYFSLLLFLLPAIASGETESSDSRIITDVYRLGFEEISPLDNRISLKTYQTKRQTAGINDTIVIKVKNLDALKKLALCIPQSQNCEPQKINLYFNGKKIAAKDPKDGLLGREPDTIEFELEYDSNKVPDLKKHWASLLGSPTFFSGEFFQRPVQIKIGLDTGTLYSYDGQFQLRRIDMVKFWIFIAILTIISAIVLSSQNVKQKIREALSDIGPAPVSGFKTLSLARCQMAFWFVLVAVSFLSIWAVTGALDTITGSVLALIGMGSGAALGSAMIDVSSNSQLKQLKLIDLNQKQITLTEEIANIDSKLAAANIATDQKKYLEDLKKLTMDDLTSTRQQILKKTSIRVSQGFWNDILNDPEGGAGFHRIQMVVWTLILGGIFVFSVWQTLSMPDFSETLLALQGLSAGTYLGFKIPEKKS